MRRTGSHLFIVPTPAPPSVSSGTGAGEFAGPGPVDLWGYRRRLPDRWATLLRAHFRCPVHVAFAFGVDERTARNWWEGTCSPRAEAALIAARDIPGALALLLEAA